MTPARCAKGEPVRFHEGGLQVIPESNREEHPHPFAARMWLAEARRGRLILAGPPPPVTPAPMMVPAYALFGLPE